MSSLPDSVTAGAEPVARVALTPSPLAGGGATLSTVALPGDDGTDEDADLGGPAVGMAPVGPLGLTLSFPKLDFEANKEEFERQFLIAALKTFKGRINQTAIHANIPKKTLLRKLEKYGINARDYSPS